MTDHPHVDHSRDATLEFFRSYTKNHRDELRGKVFCDLSAGRGYIANLFELTGVEPRLYDLFPNQNRFAKSPVERIDLQQPFPIASQSVDLAICCETIEHLPNQFFLFQETSRILKTGGTFILTTPNSSSLRSRFSQFLMESEHYGAPAPNELNAFTPWNTSGTEGYFSKLFISGVLRLRTLAAINELRLKKLHPTKRSSTSFWLMLLFYPALYFANRKATKKQIKLDPAHEATYKNIMALNTSFDILLGKHLILEFEKC